MSKFKKLIPALCMLLVSAVMLGSTTFAWFAMNDSVSATGMSVTAKSDTTYLMISSDDNAFSTGITYTEGEKALKPCAYTTTDIANTEIQGDNFYTAISEDYDVSNVNVTGYQKVTKSDGTYMLTNTVYLKLSNDSAPITEGYNLNLTYTTEDDTHASVKAIVEIDNVLYQFTDDKATVENFTISNSASTEVKIYVYIDGTDEDVTSKNASEGTVPLSGNVGVTFMLEPQA